jgi:hypothetical protein
MGRSAAVALAMLSLLATSACSGAARPASSSRGTSGTGAPEAYAWRAARGTRVLLAPLMDGGEAGWCMQIVTHRVEQGGNSYGWGCAEPATTSAGPILAESCGARREGPAVYVLTRGEVASVAIGRGAHVPTSTNATLPDGLRVAALEAPGYRPAWRFKPCPTVTPLDSSGRAIPTRTGRATPLATRLPHSTWAHPDKPLHGVCGLTATKLAPGLGPLEGSVAATVRAVPGLLGRAFVSCARTVYDRPEGQYITAAVLLDAAHPGAPPAPLPGMTPLRGDPGLFEAFSSEGQVVARRIPGAWLVATEQAASSTGPTVELLENMQAVA